MSTFNVFIGRLCVFFGKISIRILCPFLMGLFYFYCWIVKNLWIFWIQVPCQVYKHVSILWVLSTFLRMPKLFPVWWHPLHFPQHCIFTHHLHLPVFQLGSWFSSIFLEGPNELYFFFIFCLLLRPWAHGVKFILRVSAYRNTFFLILIFPRLWWEGTLANVLLSLIWQEVLESSHPLSVQA